MHYLFKGGFSLCSIDFADLGRFGHFWMHHFDRAFVAGCVFHGQLSRHTQKRFPSSNHLMKERRSSSLDTSSCARHPVVLLKQ